MEAQLSIRERPDVTAEERASSDLVKLVRKLRWIGMEEEAEQMQMQIALRLVDSTAILLACPNDTD